MEALPIADLLEWTSIVADEVRQGRHDVHADPDERWHVRLFADERIDVADIYSTTPAIAANKLVTLEDPENLIAAQNVVPLIRSAKATGEVTEVLNEVAAALTTEGLLELNAENQGKDKVAPDVLAKQWVADTLK